MHFTLIFLPSILQVGSVDEGSTKSDEEYEDLAMQDVQKNGYWSDDDEDPDDKVVAFSGDQATRTRGDKYNKNLDLFLRSRGQQFSEPLCSHSSLLTEKNERGLAPLVNVKMKKRSLSIPALAKHGSIISDPILSGAPQW